LNLVRQVGVRLAVEQQAHHLEVAVLRGQIEPRSAVLPRAVVLRGEAVVPLCTARQRYKVGGEERRGSMPADQFCTACAMLKL
jgi:hypothetical protein